MRLLRKFLVFIGVGSLLFLAYHYDSVIYGIQQGAGQVKVLWNAEEISDLIQDPTFPDSTKEKFKYIAAVKAWAEGNIGLTKTNNYTTYYEQYNKPILWVVTASPEFKIEAYEWDFPIAGGFPYKGFWDIEKAKKEELRMKELGYDTELDEVNAWSTLGWFRDPILSSMLNRDAGRLAELIIHESTHATLYVKDSVEFNENLASFIGKAGAELFLKSHFGDTSKEFIQYAELNQRKTFFKNYMRNEIDWLNEQYSQMDSNQAIEKKRKLKSEWIDKIKMGLYSLPYQIDSSALELRLDTMTYNNAYFSGFATYADDLPKLQQQLKKEFGGDLKEMVTSFKQKYKSL